MSTLDPEDVIVDARTEPEAAQQKLEAVFKEPPLLLDSPPSDAVELPAGFADEQGIIHRQARIRELNGRDEEYLARQVLNTTIPISQFVDAVLCRNVTHVGTIESPSKETLRRMLRGDRYALAIAIRRLTYGDDWELMAVPCPSCKELFDVVVELNKDLHTRILDNPHQRTIDVPLRHGHKATVRFVTGEDELAAVAGGDRTIPELSTAYINRCLLSMDDDPVLAPMAEDMGVLDRQKIIDALQEKAPGPIMEEVSVPCSHCGFEFNYSLNMADLFRV